MDLPNYSTEGIWFGDTPVHKALLRVCDFLGINPAWLPSVAEEFHRTSEKRLYGRVVRAVFGLPVVAAVKRRAPRVLSAEGRDPGRGGRSATLRKWTDPLTYADTTRQG